jgi:hypothetical protein
VGVAGDQGDAGQAASHQTAEQLQPTGFGLGASDLDPEDFAVSVGVSAGRDQHVVGHHPAALADLHGQRVGGHERVRASIQRAGPELLDVLVEVLGHHRHLRLGQSGDAQLLDQLLHPPSGDAEQVADRDHRHHGPLGSLAASQ